MEQTSLVWEVWWIGQVHVIIEKRKKRGTHPNNTNAHLPSCQHFFYYFGCTNYIIYVHYISDSVVSLYHIYSYYKTIRFFKDVWHESMEKCGAMELDGEEEKPFIFLPTSFFSLHIFMHSHKVDSEFTSPPLTFSRLILNLFMPLKIYICIHVIFIWKRETY